MTAILWHSNAPWAPTGYGQQTALFAPRLRDLGHQVGISAFWGLAGQTIEWQGMPVYPSDDKWGNRTLTRLAEHHGGPDCLVITLMDVWVLSSQTLPKLRLAAWVPVDHDPAPPKVIDFFKRTGARPIAMSRFGGHALRAHGLDPLYVPHGIDTSVFQPRPEGARELRDLMKIPQDAFVVGMVAANKGALPPRKAFPQVFQAFSRLRAKHPDAYLYLHTELAGVHGGVNLGALAAACGIPPAAIRYTPPWQMEMGADPEALACVYSMMDVLANPSYGEGFGIPIMEAQACGTPVIVTDHSAMRELCGAGWLVGGDPWYDASQGSFYRCPSIADIHKYMVAAHRARGDEKLSQRAVEFAAGYDADLVLEEFWKPALAELDKPRAITLSNEPWLNGHLPAGGRTAIDVGANRGDVTERLLESFDRVHAFEPHPDACRELRQRASRATVHQRAVGDEDHTVTLNLYEDSLQTSMFGDRDLDTLPRGASTGTVTVSQVTLDGQGFDDVDFIKIDVEGMECHVLRGAERLLRDQQPRLLIEIHSAANGEWCRGFLARLGYQAQPVPHPHPGVPAGHHWLACTPVADMAREPVLAEAA